MFYYFEIFSDKTQAHKPFIRWWNRNDAGALEFLKTAKIVKISCILLDQFLKNTKYWDEIQTF